MTSDTVHATLRGWKETAWTESHVASTQLLRWSDPIASGIMRPSTWPMLLLAPEGHCEDSQPLRTLDKVSSAPTTGGRASKMAAPNQRIR
ncbi:hypothetical protein VZT92_008450 [Zoarces viviparus]|uniref:Uncharacterized protein n=1 Tax=Zoarces viviparus TaxID=48416 RepID=A0AAW1FFM4_ZOAVI